MEANRALMEAALLGYQAQIAQIEQAIADLKRHLGSSSSGSTGPAAGQARRKISSAARKRMAAAQKRRWAEYRKKKAASA